MSKTIEELHRQYLAAMRAYEQAREARIDARFHSRREWERCRTIADAAWETEQAAYNVWSFRRRTVEAEKEAKHD